MYLLATPLTGCPVPQYRIQVFGSGTIHLFCYTFKHILLDFSLTVKAATLIFISGCGSAISTAKEGKSGFIYNLVKG